jgi:hypothetical protein
VESSDGLLLQLLGLLLVPQPGVVLAQIADMVTSVAGGAGEEGMLQLLSSLEVWQEAGELVGLVASHMGEDGVLQLPSSCTALLEPVELAFSGEETTTGDGVLLLPSSAVDELPAGGCSLACGLQVALLTTPLSLTDNPVAVLLASDLAPEATDAPAHSGQSMPPSLSSV